MMAPTSPRIGLIGYGYIGRYIYEQIVTRPELGLQIGFVHNRSAEAVAELPTDIVLEDVGDFAGCGVDLIVELAHPDVTRLHGEGGNAYRTGHTGGASRGPRLRHVRARGTAPLLPET